MKANKSSRSSCRSIPRLRMWLLLPLVLVTANPTTKTKKTVAVVELMQETNSFSPVWTTRQEFESTLLLYGHEDIIQHVTTEETHGHVAGFLDAVNYYGEKNEFDLVPILQARSVSGGPLQHELYQEFKKTILEALQHLGNVDGIYLSLHGAMGVQDMLDPEGDLLEAIHNMMGPNVIIGVTHDLHANLTRKRMELMTYLIGYRTNPHRDFYQVGYKAGELMALTLQGKISPTMAYQKMRLLKGGGMNIDLLSPMRSIFSWMSQQEKHPQVLALSNFMVHFWLDDPELGWTTVVVTNNSAVLADDLANDLADLNWQVRGVSHPTGLTPAEAIQMTLDYWWRRYFGTVIFCDVSDAVGAGSPGESTWILQALLEHANKDNGEPLVSYMTLRDKEAVQIAFDHNIGDNLNLTVGGKLDTHTNRPVEFKGRLLQKLTSPKACILKYKGIHLILNEIAAPLHSPDYFHDLGLSLWKADIVVVKNLFPFRYKYLLYNRMTVNVLTPGITNIDVHSLDYQLIPRPIYPLDQDMETWRIPTSDDGGNSSRSEEQVNTIPANGGKEEL